MTTIDAAPAAMSRRQPSLHPVLRTALQETGRLCAMVAGYGALIGLFVLAAISLWGSLPSAVADARLVPAIGATDAPVKLRGAL